MASIKYDEIYSKFYTKVEAYDILDLEKNILNEFLCNWIHSSMQKPYIRRLFSSLKFDDEIMTLTYEMNESIDEDFDKEFVIETASLGMVIEWLEPKIASITNIAQMFGSKEEKFYSEANHLRALIDLKDSLYQKQRKMIRDRGYSWNSYINE